MNKEQLQAVREEGREKEEQQRAHMNEEQLQAVRAEHRGRQRQRRAVRRQDNNNGPAYYLQLAILMHFILSCTPVSWRRLELFPQ